MSHPTIKRSLDFVCAVLFLVITAPIMAAIAAGVALKLGSPVLFRQPRAGLNGRIFEIVKFRTMTEERDAHGELLPPASRLTRFGRFLRGASLDELPQLWNVLRGEMSLVGPRPLLVDYLPLYSPEQARRHEVRPGITGWAQVQGRNAISWEEKFALDVWYVDHQSLGLDLKIVLLTLQKLVKREGISPRDRLIMPKFTGSEPDTN